MPNNNNRSLRQRRPKRRPRPRDPIADAINRITNRFVDIADDIIDAAFVQLFPNQTPPPRQQSQSQSRQQSQSQSHSQSSSGVKDSGPNLYEILEVSESASQETIEAAWKSLSKRYHPDNQKTGDHEKAKAINHAHDILSDPEKRKIYNVMLRRQRQSQ